MIWLPHAPQDDVATLIQNAGALMQPSVYEGFGLPVLEAMACGCPVVATNIAPFREIADGAALLVPPDDVGALASAVREVVAVARAAPIDGRERACARRPVLVGSLRA